MGTLERKLAHTYQDYHKKEHLWAKVVDEVRQEAQTYAFEPETYEGYIMHLQTIENQIPTRKAMLLHVARDKGKPRHKSRSLRRKSKSSTHWRASHKRSHGS